MVTHDDLIAKTAALEAELLEQARIVGAGGERELALLAKVERLEVEVARLREAHNARPRRLRHRDA